MLNKRYKLQANAFAPGTFSHQLYVYCSIIGKSTSKAQIRKTVNYYRFRDYVENEMKVVHFDNWYWENKNSVSFLFALADFINKIENRTVYYSYPCLKRQLDDACRLIDEKITSNQQLILEIMQSI